jgi:tRNA G18 (ribose-2'-O)-methylase SpoU
MKRHCGVKCTADVRGLGGHPIRSFVDWSSFAAMTRARRLLFVMTANGMIARRCQSFMPNHHGLRPHRPPSLSFRTNRFFLPRRSTDEKVVLDWESFEFGTYPKWDRRFNGEIEMADGLSAAAKETALKELYDKDSEQDTMFAKELNAIQTAWQRLDAETVELGIGALSPYVRPDRVERIEQVLRQRTVHTRFLFENPANPSNVWACLRTIEAFGILHVDLVVESAKYTVSQSTLMQKRGMRTAMGSAQWLTLTQYDSTESAIRELKKTHRIVASDLSPGSKDIREIDWDNIKDSSSSDDSNGNAAATASNDDRPICIVMGNEEDGISDAMRAAADERFVLPMVGFAESFNLSVATAITLAHLSAASSSSGCSSNNDTSGDIDTIRKGPLRPGDLPYPEYRRLLLRGLFYSVAQKRVAAGLLKQAGLDLPYHRIS